MHHSHEPVLDDWVSFVVKNTASNPRRKDYAWLLDLNSYAHMLLADECSPAFREEIMKDLGHDESAKNDISYEA